MSAIGIEQEVVVEFNIGAARVTASVNVIDDSNEEEIDVPYVTGMTISGPARLGARPLLVRGEVRDGTMLRDMLALAGYRETSIGVWLRRAGYDSDASVLDVVLQERKTDGKSVGGRNIGVVRGM